MTLTPPSPPRRPTAQQIALEHIRDLISQGFLKPDDRIRQEQLAAELGSSVIPVREALKTLEAEGQVRYAPHRGYHVARLSLEELTETYRIRELLEDDLVRTAVPLLLEEHYLILDRAMDAMEAASSTGDIATMIESNREFHFTIFAAAMKPRMVDIVRVLWQQTDPYRSLYYADPQARQLVDLEHRSIVTTLRSGDVARAIEQLGLHREHAVAALALRLQD